MTKAEAAKELAEMLAASLENTERRGPQRIYITAREKRALRQALWALQNAEEPQARCPACSSPLPTSRRT